MWLNPTLLPPLPIIEEEDAPETNRTNRNEAKTPADTEITPEAFVGAINEINDDKSKNSEEFFYPNDSEEVLENPQDVLIKIADICDSLINGQENCVSWIQSEDSVNSQTEELVETLEGLQSELRIYKDLLMENTGHAPAMKSIVDSMRPDIERMSNESYGMSYTGVLPKHGEQICRCLGGQWETMGELCDLLDKLAPLQKTNRQVEPATASQDDAAADPEESMATFHVFIASENQGVKNAPERTDRSLQPNKNCQGPKSVSSATEVLEMPHDVFVKITNSCEALLQEQRKCVQLWRSEINPDYETEVLIGALEDFQAELKLYRDLITKDLNRTNATSSALANMSKELERLLTLADQLTRIGFLPISGGPSFRV